MMCVSFIKISASMFAVLIQSPLKFCGRRQPGSTTSAFTKMKLNTDTILTELHQLYTKEHFQINLYTGNFQLSGVMERRKVTDNRKPWLKQKQSKHSTKWI
jgi:hypothetical protein